MNASAISKGIKPGQRFRAFCPLSYEALGKKERVKAKDLLLYRFRKPHLGMTPSQLRSLGIVESRGSKGTHINLEKLEEHIDKFDVSVLREQDRSASVRERVGIFCARLAEPAEVLELNREAAALLAGVRKFVDSREIKQSPWQEYLEPIAFGQHPLTKYLANLERGGLSDPHFEASLNVLSALGVDIMDHLLVRDFLSDLMGFSYKGYTGHEPPLAKQQVRDWVLTPPLPLGRKAALERLGISYVLKGLPLEQRIERWRQAYRQVKARLFEMASSDYPFVLLPFDIERLHTSAVAKIVGEVFATLWRQEGIVSEVGSFVYMRDMKSLGSDLDLFYVGPEAEKINDLATPIFYAIGLKRDFSSTIMMEQEIEALRIGYEIVHYFMGGEVIHLVGSAFKNFHQNWIMPRAKLGRIQSELYPYLSRQLRFWASGEEYDEEIALGRYDFKNLHTRALFNLLFCLGKKAEVVLGQYNCNFSNEWVRDLLGEKAADELFLIAAFSLQARNVVQLVTSSRWDNSDPLVMREVERVLNRQGLGRWGKLNQVNQSSGEFLVSLAEEHLGPLDFSAHPKYMGLYRDQRIFESWDQVVQRLKNSEIFQERVG